MACKSFSDKRTLRLRSWCLIAKAESPYLKCWFKTPIQNALHWSTLHASLEIEDDLLQSCNLRIVRAFKWTGQGVYMTSFKRGYMLFCYSCFHQIQRFALTTIVSAHNWAAYMLILRRHNQHFKTLIQNADSKRSFTGVLFMIPSRSRRFRDYGMRIVRGYCSSSSEPERRLHDVIIKYVWYVNLRGACTHQHQRSALTTRVNAHFWPFCISLRSNDGYSRISMDATALCSIPRLKTLMLASKVKHERNPFWIGVDEYAVYSKSAFWNAVYSKISMDATAFCSNHVWKRWFWPQ